MASTTNGAKKGAAAPDWTRKYPPLLAMAVAVLIAVIVLPSSLNLPQTNPTQTLEFAPVPPEDSDEPPPPVGNLSSLGMASSSGIQSGGEGDGQLPELPPDEVLEGVGKSPRTKDCVNTPEGPRQTDDPLSPPCVADFRGDNGGSTYQGVSREEVRVLFYFQGFSNYVNLCRDPNQSTPDKQYFDLALPPEPNEHCILRVLRNWQQYFNDRYQTYNRFVHFFVYVSGQGRNAEERRADAAENYAKIKPFAVVTNGSSFAEAYLDTMAKRGVLNFGSFAARTQAFFNTYPGMIWGYNPSLEKQAEIFASYLCTKVAPHPTQFSKNANQNGQPRKYALWSTSDDEKPELQQLAAATKQLVSGCGIEFDAERRFPSAGYVQDNRYSPRYATEAVAEFKQKDITTVIWPGGLETNFTKQAAQLNYAPEIIALGDGVLEKDTSGGFQEQSVWDQAHMVTNVVTIADVRQSQCYLAYREADPTADDNETRAVACPLYNDLRQLFTGIQVAGPKLNPSSVDKGMHAIPAVRSPDPSVPACFYDPGDYTCVKDALVERWDSAANDGDQGCFRATEGGQRYFAGIWPEGNVQDQEKPDDPCNAYDGSFLINPSPPEDPTSF